MRVRATTLFLAGAERFLVIPADAEAEDLYIGGRELSPEVICHASSKEWSEKIAEALNRMEAS